MDCILEIDHAGKAYDKFTLKDVHFQLDSGVIMGLIGTNGAGKTTLIQMILGLLDYEGTIRIAGKDINTHDKEVKDLCGFVLDDNPFLKPVSVIGNARIFGPYYSRWDEKKFEQYCKKFDVPLKKKLNKLSQGTVTKFQLAFALSHDAKLLILDEPAAGLDPIFRRELIDIMYEITMDGERSVLFSTHLTNDLDLVADYLVMLHEGEQLFAMEKDSLMESYLLVRGSKSQIDAIPDKAVVAKKDALTYSEALIKSEDQMHGTDLTYMKPTIEDIMVYLVKSKEDGTK